MRQSARASRASRIACDFGRKPPMCASLCARGTRAVAARRSGHGIVDEAQQVQVDCSPRIVQHGLRHESRSAVPAPSSAQLVPCRVSRDFFLGAIGFEGGAGGSGRRSTGAPRMPCDGCRSSEGRGFRSGLGPSALPASCWSTSSFGPRAESGSRGYSRDSGSARRSEGGWHRRSWAPALELDGREEEVVDSPAEQAQVVVRVGEVSGVEEAPCRLRRE